MFKYVLGFALIGLSFENIEQCDDPFENNDWMKVANDPNVEELKVVCPLILNFITCIENAIGITVEQFAGMVEDESAGKAATVLVNIKQTFTDLCTEGSPLNTEYQEHAACLKTVLPDDGVECENMGNAAYNTYKGLEGAVQEDAGDTPFANNEQCLKKAYTIACVGEEIHKTCGESAFNTFNTIIKRTTIFRNGICSADDLQELQTTFLESLNMEETRKSIFRKAFDLKRRRK